MISSCALSAIQIELLFHYHGEAVDCLGNPMGGWREETRRGRNGRERGKGGGKSKQSLVNFPEGRPRAWLGRGPGDGQSKAAFQLIKRQAPYYLQSTKCACGMKERKCA